MINGYLLQKKKMTYVYSPEGKRITVTACHYGPLVVTQIKSVEKDGYSSVQFAYGTKKTLNQAVSKKLSQLKLDISPSSFKEFRLTGDIVPEVGQQVDISAVFQVGDVVKATSVSKGHGFAGVIKRYGFQRQPVSGGQSDRVRAPGSIGAQTPGKVVKGKKMPGHYGNVSKSILNLKIVTINPEKQEVLVSGSVPGHFNSWVELSK